MGRLVINVKDYEGGRKSPIFAEQMKVFLDTNVILDAARHCARCRHRHLDMAQDVEGTQMVKLAVNILFRSGTKRGLAMAEYVGNIFRAVKE